MGGAFLRMFVVLTLALILTAGALILWLRARRITALLQLIGAAGILVVAVAHLAETAHFLSFMGWGRPDTVGHYLDLAGAIVGGTLFPGGYVAHALTSRRT